VDALAADWTAICRRVVAAQRTIFAEVTTSAERTVYEGVGEGGDHTLEIDRRCEDVVFAELDALAAQGASFLAVSEERGEVEFGDGGEVRVVIDPIDGSLNARRTIPSHSLSVAVSSGPSMADVEFGFVYDFGAGEEFLARRGDGATVDSAAARVAASDGRLEVVGLESMEPQWSQGPLEALVDKAYRLRVIGSIAITAAYVGAGRFDAFLSLRPCRSVDAAAAQLFAREGGAKVAFGDLALEEAGLDLGSRYPFAAARDEESLATVLAAQRAERA
jgi:myo-inositol-1(or 4)-monophosphatase